MFFYVGYLLIYKTLQYKILQNIIIFFKNIIKHYNFFINFYGSNVGLGSAQKKHAPT